MLTSYLLSSQFPSSVPSLQYPNAKSHLSSKVSIFCSHSPLRPPSLNPATLHGSKLPFFLPRTRGILLICRDSDQRRDFDGEIQEKETPLVAGSPDGGGGGTEWISSALLFGLWAGLMFYVLKLTPDQTPFRDRYFVEKLCNLRGDDGVEMNPVLVAVWYIMGLWPIVYSLLLIPTGRSAKSKIPAWPFLTLSFFGGAYALIPYFVLWRPPPPPIEEDEIAKWPLNFLESKITAGILLVVGLGLITYAGLAGEDAWSEYYQNFRESKFIHIMSIDLSLLSAFAPFWVYNDMTARRWLNKGSWLLPVSLIPIIGPSLYLLLRPSLSSLASSSLSVDIEQD